MKNLAIFYGGKSVEHDISIITALQVMKNINKDKYNIVPIYVSKNNTWHILKDYLNINNYAKSIFKGKQIACGFFNKYILNKSFLGYKKFKKIDVAINCIHGFNGEDGTLSGLLELNNIPYVGSDVLSSSIGMDKVIQKDIFVKNDIPCANYFYFMQEDYLKNKQDIIIKAQEKLTYPMIVKPARLGSSIGINICKNEEELQKNIEIALNFDKKIIIESVIQNLREINCSVIGNYKYAECSVLEEPKNWETFLDFNEKYLVNNKTGAKKQIDILLKENLNNKIKELSIKVFKLLGCCGVVRIDFLLNNKTNDIYVNEINTVPGSFANYLWKHKYTFSELVDKLIALSEEEYLYKQENNYTFSSNVLNLYSTNNIGGKKMVK